VWKKEELKNPSEYGIVIDPKITALINKFDRSVKIRIKDTPKIFAQASCANPAYITLSVGLFSLFTTEEIITFVAHELGHIIPKSDFNKITYLFLIGFVLSVFGCLISICFHYINYLSCFAFLIGLLFIVLGVASHREEYRADYFAVTEAKISPEAFRQAFLKGSLIREREDGEKDLFSLIVDGLINRLTHPTIKKRIARVQTLG